MISLQIVLLLLVSSCVPADKKETGIDRQSVVERHKIITTATNPRSPVQVGNGEFAFGVDITGLQTFVPFNTMSHWGWHSDPLPEGMKAEDFKGKIIETHGRPVWYPLDNEEQPELSMWLKGNPHRINLGRLAFDFKKADGSLVRESDLQNIRQEVDLWTGIITSYFELEGTPVHVTTSCHPDMDVIGVIVNSDLLKSGRLNVTIEFPYATAENSLQNDYVGIFQDGGGRAELLKRTIITAPGYKWDITGIHKTLFEEKEDRVNFTNILDNDKYHAALAWETEALFMADLNNPHRFKLSPKDNTLSFVCAYAPEEIAANLPSAQACVKASKTSWPEFWKSGAAIDLSSSTDPRWMELERRIVLSQYLMRVNEAGTWPPQESGLVSNSDWFGRFHFEMIPSHVLHWALWNRWEEAEKSLHVYRDFLPIAKKRAAKQGYKGARWPKCTAPNGTEWPHPIHAMLTWQQPHPIYFAELNYRLNPTKATLEKWRDVVFETAEFMADFAWYEKENDRYILGPQIFTILESNDPATTINPCLDLGYWRFGLRVAQEWRERLGLDRVAKWDDVLEKLSPLPQKDDLYIAYETIDSANMRRIHSGTTYTYGNLPGDGVDIETMERTFNKITEGDPGGGGWMALTAARLNHPEKAIDALLSSMSFSFNESKYNSFDEHGFAMGYSGGNNGWPFPFFPSNGDLLTAIAMMAGGWDGAPDIPAPGFPKNGKWVVKYEGFNKMP